MKARTKLLVVLGLVAVLAARELGAFDVSLAQAERNSSSSVVFSPGERPERAYRTISIEVLEAGEGLPTFRVGPGDALRWTVVLDEPEFSGPDWVPLYKRMTYRIEVQAGNLGGATVGGVPLPGKPEDGAPNGFSYTVDGDVTAFGVQSRRGLRQDVIDAVIEDVRESLTESLLEMEPADAWERGVGAEAPGD
jgi:hypothetical protein